MQIETKRRKFDVNCTLRFLLGQQNFGGKGSILRCPGQVAPIFFHNGINAGKPQTMTFSLAGSELLLPGNPGGFAVADNLLRGIRFNGCG